MKRQKAVPILASILLAILLVGLVFDTAVASPADWLMYRNNPLHTGVATDIVPPPLSLKWKQTFTSPVVGSPVVVGSRLYVGSNDGNLYAIDTATGNIIWTFNDAGATLPPGCAVPACAWDSSPAVATVGGQTVIFAGNNNKNLYAVRDDGTTPFKLWVYLTGGSVESSPVVTTIAGTQVVIVGSVDNGLYAFVAATGAKYPGWTTNPFIDLGATASFLSSPAILGSTAFIGNNNGRLYAINLGNGIKLWDSFTTPIPTPLAGLVVSSPAIANVAGEDRVFVGADGSKLYAFAAATGILRWSQPVGGPIRSSPALATIPNPPVACAPGPTLAVIFGSDDGNVYAMRASDGTPCWTFPSTGLKPFESSAVVSGQTVYIGSDDFNFYAIDINTGSWQWSYPALDKVGSGLGPNPAVSGSTVYFAAGLGSCIGGCGNDKRLYAFQQVIPVATTTSTSTIVVITTTTVPVTQTTTVATTTVSTATTQTMTTTQTQTATSTFITTTTQTVTGTSTSTTVPPVTPPQPSIIPVIIVIVAGLAVLLVVLLLLLTRRGPNPPAVCYPIQRRQ